MTTRAKTHVRKENEAHKEMDKNENRGQGV